MKGCGDEAEFSHVGMAELLWRFLKAEFGAQRQAFEFLALACPGGVSVFHYPRPAGRVDRDADSRPLLERQLAQQLQGAILVSGFDFQALHDETSSRISRPRGMLPDGLPRSSVNPPL